MTAVAQPLMMLTVAVADGRRAGLLAGDATAAGAGGAGCGGLRVLRDEAGLRLGRLRETIRWGVAG